MNIEKDIFKKLNELSDLFSDHSKVKVVHIPSITEEPLSYYFVFIPTIDLEKKQSYLGQKSFIGLMLDILEEKYDKTRKFELEYSGTMDELDDYKPGSMYLLEEVLLNPYEPGERDDTRSYYAYKHYVRNCFYDWYHSVDWKGRTDIVKVNDISFTPKKSLKSLLELKGFSKSIIPFVHIIRCIRHPVGDTVHYFSA